VHMIANCPKLIDCLRDFPFVEALRLQKVDVSLVGVPSLKTTALPTTLSLFGVSLRRRVCLF